MSVLAYIVTIFDKMEDLFFEENPWLENSQMEVQRIDKTEERRLLNIELSEAISELDKLLLTNVKESVQLTYEFTKGTN